MSLQRDELREHAEARSTHVMRHLAGWLLGSFVILVGVFFGLGGVNALDGNVLHVGPGGADPDELVRGLVLIGAGVVAVACGLFSVLTGYAPRASYTSGRPDPSYGRIRLAQAWRGLGRRKAVRPALCGISGLGLLIAAGGSGIVSLLYR